MSKVSVNIPVYNDERYIRQTLDSVLNQTYKELEVVIVDDGSTDRTAEIINGYKDPRVKYHYQANQGIGAARNKALALSTGEYIAFLDHDDLWLPDKLAKQMALFSKEPQLGLVYCDTIFFNEKGDMYSIFAEWKPPRGRVFPHLLQRYWLSCETVMIKRSILAEVGIFQPQLMMAEEYDLFLHIAYHYPINYIDEPLAKYRIHEKNYSWGREIEGIKEERSIIDDLVMEHPEIDVIYRSELEARRADLDLREAMAYWRSNNNVKASSLLYLLAKKRNNIKIFIMSIIARWLRHAIAINLIKQVGKSDKSFNFG